jgi:hypothetical protein
MFDGNKPARLFSDGGCLVDEKHVGWKRPHRKVGLHKSITRGSVKNDTLKRPYQSFGWLLGLAYTQTERKGRQRNRPYHTVAQTEVSDVLKR